MVLTRNFYNAPSEPSVSSARKGSTDASGDVLMAERPAPGTSSSKRKQRPEISITDLAGFYQALKSEEELDDDEIKRIEVAFNKEKIRFKTLPRLNDEKLEKDGIRQRGLREAILDAFNKLY
jgi:hypothetical protein